MRKEKIECPYSAEVIEKIDNGKGYWSYLSIGIFETIDGVKKQIGQYKRNYSTFYNTFFPFYQDAEWYALYSKDYTATRVMKLPSCEDLCGEEHDGNGFCPTGYYVPYNDPTLLECDPNSAETMGFVSGCVWGDDSSWKIQFLDLSNIKSGVLTNEPRFGYVELPPNLSLEQSISFESWDYFPNTEKDYKYYKEFTDPKGKRITINTHNTYSFDGEKQTTHQGEWELEARIDDLKNEICEYVYKLGGKPTYKQILPDSNLKHLHMPTLQHEAFFQSVIDKVYQKVNRDRKKLLDIISINYKLQSGLLYCFNKDGWSPEDKKINNLLDVIMGKKEPVTIKGLLNIKDNGSQKEYYIEEQNFWTKNKLYKLISFDDRTSYKLSDWTNGTKIETNGFINTDGTFSAYWTSQDYSK